MCFQSAPSWEISVHCRVVVRRGTGYQDQHLVAALRFYSPTGTFKILPKEYHKVQNLFKMHRVDILSEGARKQTCSRKWFYYFQKFGIENSYVVSNCSNFPELLLVCALIIRPWYWQYIVLSLKDIDSIL